MIRQAFIAVLVGLLVLLASAGVSYWFIKSPASPGRQAFPREGARIPSEAHPPAASEAYRDWPVFRGNQALTGTTSIKLPQRLVKRWDFKTGGPIKSSPVIAGNRVYIGSTDGKLYALELGTGKPAWIYDAGQPIEAPALAAFEKIYVGDLMGQLHAVDSATGKSLWKFKTQDKILGSANFVADSQGQTPRILVGSYDNKLYALHAHTGRELWSYATESFINGAPATDGRRGIVGGCDGAIHIVLSADGSLQASVPIGGQIAGSAAIFHSIAYVGHYGEEFVAVDLEAGKILWTYRDRPFPILSSPAVDEKRVIFGSRDRRVHAIDRQNGKQLWTFRTRGKVDSSPLIVGQSVIIGSDDGLLYRLNIDTGEQEWSYTIGSPISGSPAATENSAGGWIILGAEDGVVYAWGPGPNPP